MSKKKKINWAIYVRLLSYVKPYKGKLILGIFFGFVTGGSIFGLLTQTASVMGQVVGSDKQVQSVSRYTLEKPDKSNVEIMVENRKNADDEYEEQISQGEQLEVISVVTVDQSKRKEWDAKVAKIPAFLRDLLEQKCGLELQDPITGEPTGAILIIGAFFLMIALMLKSAGTFFNRYFMRWVGLRVVADLRAKLFGKLMNQSMEFHNSEEVGEMMSRCQNDTGTIQSAISENIGQLTRSPIEILSVVGFITWFSIENDLTGILIFLFLGMPVFLLPIFALGGRLKKYAKKTMEQIGNVMVRMQETLSCVRLVKAYNMETYEKDRFDNSNNRFFKLTMKSKRYELLLAPMTEAAAVCFAVIFLIYSVVEGVTFDKIAALGIAANLAYKPFKSLTKIQANIIKTVAAAERIFEYLDMDYEIKEKPQAKALPTFQKEITFRDVCFSYDGQQTLKNVNITIPKGNFVAFVGEAGSGKTTLVNMLARFYDIHEGSIAIDGVDIRDIRNDSLRNLIGFVDQVTTLFNDSVKYNIAYGVEGASDEAIDQASKQADVTGFINDKEEGFKFNVGTGGTKLSGGQRQRVAIARAILKNPPILVLDEATSALDNVTEQLVQQAINELMTDRTVIAIAHRLSTVKDADCIYVMDKGYVAEYGSHEDLLAQNGLYARLWNTQFKEQDQ
ncbi:phospholipid-lipopolysaccharide ABC transporter [Lentisphaera araneosa HTCC2155]|uniref:Phospholipid-lipopolysaccharide ABC transporter n=1 Tax=Lentisphaera araneosa HTCC2155 TaxID=313628 RepID=A6DQ58_9BACT|nr:ABC transporter ATP-binding protein [Lentisphaera araneosa]EDM26299.1 phospholipid-lipopolysaccharide ABC transporter [Lentisphaera araneosa HTCC2155]